MKVKKKKKQAVDELTRILQERYPDAPYAETLQGDLPFPEPRKRSAKARTKPRIQRRA